MYVAEMQNREWKAFIIGKKDRMETLKIPKCM